MTKFLTPLACCLLVATAAAAGPEITPGEKSLPRPGESFRIDGRDAFVILPKEAAGATPWVWYAPTLKGLPGKEEVWMFERFLAAGVAVAGVDVGESFGSPDGRAAYSAFYDHLTTDRGFGARPCLLARSRGGLMLYGWAAENPGKVSGAAGIYPVCNIASYPGVAKAAPAYGLTAEEMAGELTKHNPVDRLRPLAEAKVPVFHIHGDSDTVVPLAANTALLAERYRGLGGPVEVEVVVGRGHDMWEGWFRSERLTDFVIERATSAVDSEGT